MNILRQLLIRTKRNSNLRSFSPKANCYEIAVLPDGKCRQGFRYMCDCNEVQAKKLKCDNYKPYY